MVQGFVQVISRVQVERRVQVLGDPAQQVQALAVGRQPGQLSVLVQVQVTYRINR